MADARPGPGVVDTHEGLSAAVAELGDGAEGVMAHDAQVDAGRVHRPGVHLAEPVRGREPHRVFDAAVVPHAHPRVVPPVEAVPGVAAVVEGHLLFQERAPRPQGQPHPPLHPVDAVHVAHPEGGASVGMTADGVIHGRGGHPVVRDGEVELHAEGGPGPAVGHAGLLNGAVGVEHVRAVRLVDAAVEVAAQVGQDGHPEVLVLEVQGAPKHDRAPVRQVLAQRVGIVEAAGLEEVEGRVDVRRPLLVGGQVEVALPGPDRRGRLGQGGPGRREAADKGQRCRRPKVSRAGSRQVIALSPAWGPRRERRRSGF